MWALFLNRCIWIIFLYHYKNVIFSPGLLIVFLLLRLHPSLPLFPSFLILSSFPSNDIFLTGLLAYEPEKVLQTLPNAGVLASFIGSKITYSFWSSAIRLCMRYYLWYTRVWDDSLDTVIFKRSKMNDFTNILLHSIILRQCKIEIFMLNDCISIHSSNIGRDWDREWWTFNRKKNRLLPTSSLFRKSTLEKKKLVTFSLPFL